MAREPPPDSLPEGSFPADYAKPLDPPCYHCPEPRRRQSCSMPMKRLQLLALMLVSLMLPTRGIAADDTVTLNFVNADIDAVVRAVSEMTGRNFVVDPRVKGIVNIVSARPVPRSAVYPTLLSALRLQGFAAIEGDGVTKIVPEADAKQQGSTVVKGGAGGEGDRLVT